MLYCALWGYFWGDLWRLSAFYKERDSTDVQWHVCTKDNQKSWNVIMKKSLLFLLGLIGLFLLAGCTLDDGLSDYTSVSQAIMKGLPADDAHYSGVVAIGIRTRSGVSNYCTGTLIDKNVVLTAAHCVSNAENFPFTTYFNDQKIVAVFGEDVTNPEADHIFVAKRLSVHNYYNQEYTMQEFYLEGNASDMENYHPTGTVFELQK